MADLSINFAGLELKNPLVVASSDVARDIRQIKKAEESGASAVILKAILPPGVIGLGSTLRCFLDKKTNSLYGLAGTKRLTYDQGIELVKTAKKETKVKIGVNIPYYVHEDREMYAEIAKKTADAGADFIEINFSPQSPVHLQVMTKANDWESKQEAGLWRAEFTSKLPQWAEEGTKIIKQAVNIPVVTKISPSGVEVGEIALRMEMGGADAIDVMNGGGGAPRIDIFNGGKLIMPGARTCVEKTLGAAIKEQAYGWTIQVAKTVKIPILGTGGLMNWRDVVEMIMFGATATSFCTLLMIHGFKALKEIEIGLKEFMEQQGYSCIEDYRGLALKCIAPSVVACEVIPSVARIDKEKCTGCGICLEPAHCLAISMEDEKAVVDEKECLGCGTCYLFCPTGAVSMVEI
jgi:dihydroorotate dehydrogenase/NAD-dependent dihydropyrimidine dehydrogenase PreA subunit